MRDAIVAGAGYAGVAASRALNRAGWRVTLIDRRPGHELLTRLPELLSGRIEPRQASIPYCRILPTGVRLLTADIRSIDLPSLRINTSTGTIHGDWLVVALGATPGYWGTQLDAHAAHTMRSVAGALTLRAAIQRRLHEQDRVTVLIIGAGYTGTEVAGELASWPVPSERPRIRVTMIAEDEHLLAAGSAALGRRAEMILRRKGVSFLLGTSVRTLESGAVVLRNGDVLRGDEIVWAAPSVGAAPSVTPSGPWAPDGRLLTDPYLRVPGWHRVFAIGDAARIHDYVHDRPAPSSAQLAIQEAETVAENMARIERGRSPREYRPHPLGEVLSLGDDGVADVAGVPVRGRRALALKEAALGRYLYRLGGISLVRDYL